jgi:ribose transport system substrate-binding protein
MQNASRRIRFAAVGALLTLLLGMMLSAALAQGQSKTYTFALLLSTTNNPYFVTMKDAAQAEAKVLGVKLQVLDANNDSAMQTNQVQTMIAKHVDLLLLNPTNADTIVPAVKQANQAGIPVIFLDRKANSGKSLAFFASDNVEAGRIACNYIVKQLNGKGNLVILTGVPGASATNERTQGCKEVLADNSGIKVVAEQTANFDRSQGLNVMQNILTAHPQGIDAVFGENDEMSLGAVQAIKAAGRSSEMFVVSIDGTADGIQAVKEGSIALDIGQQPALMSKLGMEAGYNYLQNGTLFVPVPLQQFTAPSK